MNAARLAPAIDVTRGIRSIDETAGEQAVAYHGVRRRGIPQDSAAVGVVVSSAIQGDCGFALHNAIGGAALRDPRQSCAMKPAGNHAANPQVQYGRIGNMAKQRGSCVFGVA